MSALGMADHHEKQAARAEHTLPDRDGIENARLKRMTNLGMSWAWGTFLALLFLTCSAFYVLKSDSDRAALARFNHRSAEVIEAIENRMLAYTQALRGGLGLFRASNSISRSDWRAYTETLNLNHLYPGIQGLGYTEWVSPAHRKTYESRIRAEGFPTFKIRPPGNRDLYSSITFLEPFDKRNREAFGYDMYSQETRRYAMETARDTGKMAISGKVTLVQEISDDVQAGFLMYVPYYGARNPDNVADRRQKTIGFIYSPFRMRDLLIGILGPGLADVRLQIFDNGAITDDALMFDSAKSPNYLKPVFESTKSVTIGQREWAIKTTSLPKFESVSDSQYPLIVLLAGLLTSLLVFGVLWSFASTRQRAQNIARRMTVSLNEATRQAQDKQSRISAVFETVVDGIITIDKEGKIDSFNPAAERIFGYSSDEVIGLNVKVLMPQPFRKEHDGYLKNYRETGAAKVIGSVREVMGRRKDGSTFPLDLAVGKMEIDGEQMFTGTVRDISERKEIEKMKNEFVSTVSHELRTPLTSIMGSLGLLKGDALGTLPDKIKTILEIAYRNGDRLVNLLNDILDIEKIEAGKMEYDMKPLEIMAFVESAIEANKGYADTHKIAFVLRDTVSPTEIQGDEARLMQVMSNLMSNAAKFSPEGDKVEVSVARCADLVRITVKDNGPGIRSEHREKIFDKFSQADSSDARAKDGTGLGLSITKSIVEHHGGNIDYKSIAGEGTAFYFELPVCHIRFSSQAKPKTGSSRLAASAFAE